MGYFAKVENGIVTKVIAAEKEFFDTFVDSSPGEWIQTSYNTHNNVHYGSDGKPDDGVALRGNYAGVGYVYDRNNDVFYEQQPFPSWTLNKDIWQWQAPVPYPEDGNRYYWDEALKSWVAVPEITVS
jgi:hypothetical protein